MYRFFTQNFYNYKSINIRNNGYRDEVCAPLELLCDYEKYCIHKQLDDNLYKQTTNLIYAIKENREKYSRFELFYDDLYYLNFEAVKSVNIDEELVEAQLEMTDLALSFSYTY